MTDTPPRGPAMIAATSMLRPPPARVGKITDNFTLPRSVELKKVAAGGIGLVAGAAAWVFPIGLLFGFSFESFLFTAAAGIAIGVLVVTVSPLRGESMSRWLSLVLSSSRASKVQIGGKSVRAYIGIAPLPASAAGPTRILPGAVDIQAGTYDDRGVPVPTSEIRRAKLEQIGHRTSIPGAHEGFAPLTSLDEAPAAPTGRSDYSGVVEHTGFLPAAGAAGWPAPPLPPTPTPAAEQAPWPSPSDARPEASGTQG